jgi:ABC-2 type transport system permease protein
MPFVLITILGTALGALQDERVPKLSIKLAVYEQSNHEEEVEKLVTQFEEASLPKAEKDQIIQAIRQFNPLTVFINEIEESEELKKSITIEKIDTKLTMKQELDYSGILYVPKNFTTQYYEHAYFNKGDAPKLELKLNDSKSLESSILKNIFEIFQKEINFWSKATQYGISSGELEAKLSKEIGERETVSKKKPINSVAYYAIGMSVMFIFYVASNNASFAYEQKENHIFGRILLASVPKSVFFIGIFISTIIFAFLQMVILFGLSAIIYDVTWPSVLNFLIVTILLSAMMGGFAVLLTAINFRMNSESTARIFSSFLVPILAFFGGSFFPVSQFGALFELLASYSPGGAGISSYLKIIQGYSIGDISSQMITMLVTTIILLLLGIIIQPKRGDSM